MAPCDKNFELDLANLESKGWKFHPLLSTSLIHPRMQQNLYDEFADFISEGCERFGRNTIGWILDPAHCKVHTAFPGDSFINNFKGRLRNESTPAFHAELLRIAMVRCQNRGAQKGRKAPLRFCPPEHWLGDRLLGEWTPQEVEAVYHVFGKITHDESVSSYYREVGKIMDGVDVPPSLENASEFLKAIKSGTADTDERYAILKTFFEAITNNLPSKDGG
eukprot:gnl/MRDRNA2_/MRDRNA2_68002_c0_seq2.p1 gnl/MRDRNA2_/MRDRNA2_68002_c0~~gnl/MRDRNA2_/MRDRNA2_68002_c0_seq2.p1  ORF type:complete len:220 (+),score=31.63 gnl/MRDRNA2_/MRDRNA2_68002_c0_seq2:94-753(+)